MLVSKAKRVLNKKAHGGCMWPSFPSPIYIEILPIVYSFIPLNGYSLPGF